MKVFILTIFILFTSIGANAQARDQSFDGEKTEGFNSYDSLVYSIVRMINGPKETKQLLRKLPAGSFHISYLPVIYPLLPDRSYRISSGFGNRIHPVTRKKSFHAGVDIVAEKGTSVFATASGVVVRTEVDKYIGLVVEIDHLNGFTTLYGHLSGVKVLKGDKVVAGQNIGKVGSSGRATGDHLHYTIKKDGRPLDPSYFLDMLTEVQKEKNQSRVSSLESMLK
jgi:murein DD-endopeptidase MepM/ murein hydrolase activator NlpD